jgi:apolipoprotein N-acyltransferase
MRPTLQRETDQQPVQPPLSHSIAGGGLVEALAHRVAALTGWRRWLAALLAGAASILSMAPFHFFPVLCATLPVLVWLIGSPSADQRPLRTAALGLFLDRRRLLAAALMGWLFGYGFHVVGLYWLREAFIVTGGGLAMLWPLGVLGLPAYLALFQGLAAAVAAVVPGPPFRRVVALALALSAAEWLRGWLFTGFPWNVLGLSLTGVDALMQTSALIGIYGLTLLAVVVLAGPAVMLAQQRSAPDRARASLLAGLLLAGPLAAMYAFGAWRLSSPAPRMVDGVHLRLVQPSLPQMEKWLPEKQPEHLERQLQLTRDGPDGRGLAGITHVVWPEAAMPFLPLQRPQVLQAIAETLPDGVHLLAGVLRLERSRRPPLPGQLSEVIEQRVYNSLAVIDDAGTPAAVYDKTHLVPFGEYLPFPEILEGIGLQALVRQRGGFAIGPEPRPLLQVPGLPPVGPLICYEAVFPGSTRHSAGRPSVLLNITNDGWFGNSLGPRQHLHQARMRSVEEGLPLVRVANNGISAVYDAYGRELTRLSLDVAGVIDIGLPGSIAPPPYSRLGDLPFGLIWVLTALWLLRRTSITEN